MSSQSIVIKASFKKASSDYARAKTSAKAVGATWLGSMLVLAFALIFKSLPIVALTVALVVGAICVLFAVVDWKRETSKWTTASSSCSVGDSCGNDECAPEKQGSCATRLSADRDKAVLRGELERLSILLDRQGKSSYLFLGLWFLIGSGLAVKSPNSIATLAALSLAVASLLEIYILKTMKRVSASF
ncbi:MAG: hypothetical protein M0019_09655 [Actinomycetota bacterium]|nr:hypothetical protein [Actinomycetota bacterium]